MYGGLGDVQSPGLHNTSHYLAPAIAWNLPSDWTFRLSSGFGLNDNSHRVLLRWGISREFSGFGEKVSAFLEDTRENGPGSFRPFRTFARMRESAYLCCQACL